MATSNDPGDPAGHQDPLVDKLRPDPAAPPLPVVTLEGLAGRSVRPGHMRLYFDTSLGYYAEVALDDVIVSEAIPEDQAPFVGHKATRIRVRHDAVIDYTRSASAEARQGDPFAFSVARAAAAQSTLPAPRIADSEDGCANTFLAECPSAPDGTCNPDLTLGCRTARTDCVCPTDNTCRTDCFGATCDTCRTLCDDATCVTCRGATCVTCATACNQATCNTCNQATCQTCVTCATACNQATCNTCLTDCRGRTCVTCDTCNPHRPTCGNQPNCRF